MKKMFWIVCVLLLIFGVGVMAFRNSRLPSGLGVVEGTLAKLSKKPNSVSSQTEDKGKFVEPLAFVGSVEETQALAKRALLRIEGVEIEEERQGYIRAVAVSRLFRFRDDVELYLDDEAKLIHFRSASRVGRSDMGANHARYEIFKVFFEELGEPADSE